jgi:hypothetical protein
MVSQRQQEHALFAEQRFLKSGKLRLHINRMRSFYGNCAFFIKYFTDIDNNIKGRPLVVLASAAVPTLAFTVRSFSFWVWRFGDGANGKNHLWL